MSAVKSSSVFGIQNGIIKHVGAKYIISHSQKQGKYKGPCLERKKNNLSYSETVLYNVTWSENSII